MTDDMDVMPASQVARWLAIGVLILGAVVLYFRVGRHVPPLGHGPAPADTAATR
ncbi:MAG: hypothetical protein ACREMJ_01940 [Gemmatimonadales bacterium]